MSDARIDQAAGDIKEAAGKVTGNERLEAEGAAQSTLAGLRKDVGDMAGKAADMAGDVAGKAADVAGDVASKAADVAGDVAGKATDVAGDVASRTADALGDAGQKVQDVFKR